MTLHACRHQGRFTETCGRLLQHASARWAAAGRAGGCLPPSLDVHLLWHLLPCPYSCARVVQSGVLRVAPPTASQEALHRSAYLSYSMADPQKPAGPRKVTPLELLGAGGLALLLGAGAGFFSHFVGELKIILV